MLAVRRSPYKFAVPPLYIGGSQNGEGGILPWYSVDIDEIALRRRESSRCNKRQIKPRPFHVGAIIGGCSCCSSDGKSEAGQAKIGIGGKHSRRWIQQNNQRVQGRCIFVEVTRGARHPANRSRVFLAQSSQYFEGFACARGAVMQCSSIAVHVTMF